MEIIRGSLDDISRPASSELTGSRLSGPHCDRSCPPAPFSLVVLSNDAADLQIRSSSEEALINPSDPDKGCQVDATDEDSEELQRAIEEMKRLDEILSERIRKQKEIKRQRKELQTKLWRELLQNKPEGHSECAHEALNTRLFLALEAPTGPEEKDDFVPLFETQVPDCLLNRNQQLEQSEKRPSSSTDSFDVGHEETVEEPFEGSHCGASKGKNKQKDFVKRNIELAKAPGDQVLLTQAEKQRLAELLQEADGEEDDGARGGEEDMRAAAVLTGQGYTPEPSDLEQLIGIDSKIRLLLPVEEFLSAQSSYTNLSLCQGRGSEAGWKFDGDPQPGEKVLQDIKARRGLERRLREIQQQLETLGLGQEMTDDSAELTEEQLLGLLDECELTENWTLGLAMNDVTP